jgi:hypothetical protein
LEKDQSREEFAYSLNHSIKVSREFGITKLHAFEFVLERLNLVTTEFWEYAKGDIKGDID